MSAASFLHSSFLRAVNAVMLWLVRAEKVPQASEHLCPAKMQTRCDICSACQEWRLDCEDCRHLTVVGLHDTGPSERLVSSLEACLGPDYCLW